MKFFYKLNYFLIIVFICFSAGCTHFPKYKAVDIDKLVFCNETGKPMYDVVLNIVNTNQKVHCSYLGGGKEFVTHYPVEKFQGNAIELKWTHDRKRWHVGPMPVFMSEDITLDKPTRVIAVLGEGGSADVSFKQV